MRVIIEPDYKEMSRWAAEYVAARINSAKPTAHIIRQTSSFLPGLVRWMRKSKIGVNTTGSAQINPALVMEVLAMP